MGRLHDLVKAHRVLTESETAKERREAAERKESNRLRAFQHMEQLLSDLGVETAVSCEESSANPELCRTIARFNHEGHEVVVVASCLPTGSYSYSVDNGNEHRMPESLLLVKRLAEELADLEPKHEYW